MSRSGYSDDLEQQALAMWRGAVNSATHGRRGQKLLRDMADALDAMPNKVLVAHELVTADGQVCALGAVGVARGINMERTDPEDPSQVAAAFDIAPALAQEIAYVNDDEDGWKQCTPEQRWLRVREWVAGNLRAANAV